MGSPTGLWTSVSGSMAQSQAIDIAANNLANANTAGFKKDEPTFKEYLTIHERPPSPDVDIPRTIFRDSDFYHHDGREHAMVNVDAVVTDHSQGTFRQTNGPLDLAIEGPGYFAVQTPNGLAFTRAGDFKIAGNGQLMTNDGYRVLSLAGAAAEAGGETADAQAEVGRAPAAASPFSGALPPWGGGEQNAPGAVPQDQAQPGGLQPINLAEAMSSGSKLRITDDGKIFVGNEEIAQIAMAEFSNPSQLLKKGGAIFTNPSPTNVASVARGSRIHQGFIEGSNVNAVSEIMNVIKANRLFESNMKAIKAYNEMAVKEANEVGKL